MGRTRLFLLPSLLPAFRPGLGRQLSKAGGGFLSIPSSIPGVSVYSVRISKPSEEPLQLAHLYQKTLFPINQIKPLSTSKTSQPSKIALFFYCTHVNALNCSVPAGPVRYPTDTAAPAEIGPGLQRADPFWPSPEDIPSERGPVAVDLQPLFPISNRASRLFVL